MAMKIKRTFTKHTTNLIYYFLVTILISSGYSFLQKETVIQIDVSKILNARSVTTLQQGKHKTWTMGIDGNGVGDGYLTLSAALSMGDQNPKALPDNSLFIGTDKHPEVLLHYLNMDSISNQTLAIKGSGNFIMQVLAKKYSKMFLSVSSAEGASKIKVDLIYSDSNRVCLF